MKTVLILGSTGQVGIETVKQFQNDKEWKIISPKRNSLDLNNLDIISFIDGISSGPFGLDLIVNCAAYTDVNASEDRSKNPNLKMNGILLNTLGGIGSKLNIPIIHLSTDYVFDGTLSLEDAKNIGYYETNPTNPINEYGRIKLKGEELLSNSTKKHYIIRTSWVYSENRNNFVKHWFEHGDKQEEVNVIDDQYGRPTSAIEIAELIKEISKDEGENYGVYHYGGSEVMNWKEFTENIFQKLKLETKVNGIKSDDWPSEAKRPLNNVLNIDKVKYTFNFEPLKSSIYLSEVIRRLESANS